MCKVHDLIKPPYTEETVRTAIRGFEDSRRETLGCPQFIKLITTEDFGVYLRSIPRKRFLELEAEALDHLCFVPYHDDSFEKKGEL